MAESNPTRIEPVTLLGYLGPGLAVTPGNEKRRRQQPKEDGESLLEKTDDESEHQLDELG